LIVTIAREQLIGAFGLSGSPGVTVISAPAGFGKSTFTRDLAERFGQPWVLLRCTAEFNDPKSLARTLLKGSGVACDGLSLSDDESTLIAETRRHLIQHVITSHAPRLIVLDDLDCLTNSSAIDLLNQVLISDAVLEHIAIVAIARSAIPLRLGRLRVSGRVKRLEAADLLFTAEELEAMLQSPRLVSASAVETGTVWNVTHGWPAAVCLAALAIEEAPVAGEPESAWLERFAAYLDAYVDEVFFSHLDQANRVRWLIASMRSDARSRLPDADMERIDTNDAVKRSGRSTLEIPRVRSGQGFAMLPPLAASVRRIASAYPDLVGSAARWLVREGDCETAAQLALESGDDELISTIGVRVAHELADRSNFEKLVHWLERIPPHIFDHDPTLAYWLVAADLLRGRRFTSRVSTMEAVRSRLLASSDPLHIGRALALEGWLADLRLDATTARDCLERAFETLPTTARAERMHVATSLELLAFRSGLDEQAAAWQERAIANAADLPIDEEWSWKTTALNRANAYALRGEIHSAITKYRLVLAELPESHRKLDGMIRTRLVSLLIERDELDAASDELDRIQGQLNCAETVPEWVHQATLARVRWLIAAGHLKEAERLGNSQLIAMRRRPEKSQLVLQLATIWMANGNRAIVRSWLADVLAFEYPAVHLFGDINYRQMELLLALVEWEFEAAAQLGRELLDDARCRKNVAEEIVSAMRLAVALHHLGNAEQACDLASRAITLGRRGGFLRSLSVPGFDVGAIFADQWNATPVGQRMRHQLQELSNADDQHVPHMLSRRERELLTLVALGRSNQQIAADLFISANTVRNHLVRINHRLNASSRVEAVLKARQLGLIE
jgi:LuxR family maltose regulon positive regulatory protein